jgi:exopolysaccharide production protein ExoY
MGTQWRLLGSLCRRAADIILASAALIVSAPIMLMIAILVRVLLGAPILSAHQRVGFGGRPFSCLRFRTEVNADDLLRRPLRTEPAVTQEWQTTGKTLNDPRTNCLGHVLRTSGLDKLPQLFNVLSGDMSLVGLRPAVTDKPDCCGLSPKTTARRDRA